MNYTATTSTFATDFNHLEKRSINQRSATSRNSIASAPFKPEVILNHSQSMFNNLFAKRLDSILLHRCNLQGSVEELMPQLVYTTLMTLRSILSYATAPMQELNWGYEWSVTMTLHGDLQDAAPVQPRRLQGWNWVYQLIALLTMHNVLQTFQQWNRKRH